MKKTFAVSIAIFVSIFTSQFVANAVAWLNTISANNVIQMMGVNRYEPSGLAYNPVTNRLFSVSDDGQVSRMNLDGTGQETVRLSYVDQNSGATYRDFEAITIADPNSDKLYIGVENKDSIVEVEWPEGGAMVITRSWDLTNILIGPDNSGLEGLAFVPDGYHPYGETTSGGLFYAAVQRSVVLNDASTTNDYLIYAFDIDLNANGTTVVAAEAAHGITWAPNTPTWDISDLFFSRDTGVLYSLYDGANLLIEMNTSGEVLRDYSNVPVLDQEGVVVVTNYPADTADIYFASDFFDDANVNNPNNMIIGWFSGYPVTYFDGDGDGVDYMSDCDDSDPIASVVNLFYFDLDGDGLGSGEPLSVCGNVPPAGYVDNNNDLFEGEEALMKNGGFEEVDEDGLAVDWKRYGIEAFEVTNEDNVEGANSLKLNAIGLGAGVQQTNIPVEAGKSYRLTVNQKLLSGKMTILMGIKTSNSDFEANSFVIQPKDIWQPFVREITIPEVIENSNGVSYVNEDGTVKDFRLVISVRDGEAYVDDISLEEIDETDKSSIYEFGTANWKNYNSVAEVEEMIDDPMTPGNLVLHLVAGAKATGLDQVVKVNGGDSYELSYDVLVQTGTIKPYLIARGISKYSDFENFVNQLYAYSHQDWTKVSRIFTVPDGYSVMNVRLVVMPDSEVFFKNVELKEIAADPFENDVVRDGDMAWLDAGLWTNLDTPEIKEKIDGTLHIKSRFGFNYGVYEKNLNNLKPNTTYTVNFDVNIVAGSVRAVIGQNRTATDFERIRQRMYENVNEEWQTYSETFTTLDDPAKVYSLLIMNYKEGARNFAESYIDNVVITEVGI